MVSWVSYLNKYQNLSLPFRRIEEMPMKDVKKALEGLHSGKVRYRYVLKQDIE